MNVSIPNSRLGVVSTSEDFLAPTTLVWERLLFYEEVTLTPPFFLQWLLPAPLATSGCKSIVGSEVKCWYVQGHLIKRVTEMIESRRYGFEVTEQNLALRGVRLLGGEYGLRAVSPKLTRVTLSTRYASPHRPAWLCARVEAAICHCFHRHLLGALRQNLVFDLEKASAA